MSDAVAEVLRSLTSSKSMGAVFGASAAILAFDYFGGLTSHVVPYLALIWIFFALSGMALLVHLICFLFEKWSRYQAVQNARRTSDELINGRYKKFSSQEKAVLRKFVDRHEPSLELNEIIDDDEGLLVVKQLVQRGFLDGDIRESRWRDSMRCKIGMYRDHYQALMRRPDLVGSKSDPKDFGY